MARESTPSSPNSRFRVWNLSGDLYSHTELAENWDTLDAILGRPADGSVWPPADERGVDGGIYGLLVALAAAGDGVGAVKMMWWPDEAGDIADFVPDKWVAMVGQTLAAVDHDFPTSDPIDLPDTRNAFVIGADPAKDAGVEGSATDLHTDAPGVTQAVGGVNSGGGGSNALTHTHTVAAHTHTVPAHFHSISGHSHDMDHRHDLQEDALTTGTPSHTIHAFELARSAIKRRWSLSGLNLGTLTFDPDGSWGPYETVVTGAAGVNPTAIVPHIQHTHFPRFWAGQPRVPSYPSVSTLKTQTGATALSTSTAAAVATGTNAVATTSSTATDNRPLHLGLVFLLKVRA